MKAEEPGGAAGTVSFRYFYPLLYAGYSSIPPLQAAHPEPLAVTRPTLHPPNVKHRIAITIPPQWLTTISAVFLFSAPALNMTHLSLFFCKISVGQCLNLVRVRHEVQGTLESADFISSWESVDQPMAVDGSGANSYAMQAIDEATVVVLEFFHSRNTRRRDPLGLSGKGDVSDNLRISSVHLLSSHRSRIPIPCS